MSQASKSPVSKSPVSKSPASKSPTICFKKDKSATAFMLLGHGCDYVDHPECTVPPDWVYATSITCGNQLDASSMVEFERDFFGKNPRLYNPCKHYDYLNKQLTRNKFDDDHKFNLHIGNHPRRNTYINNYNTFLDNFFYDASGKLCKQPDAMYCTIYRSGLYFNNANTTEHIPTTPILLKRASTDQPFIITANEILYIYLDAVFPTMTEGEYTFVNALYLLQILDYNIRETKIYQYANAEETAYFYDDFRKVVQSYVSKHCASMRDIMEHLSHMFSAGVLYMTSCRDACADKNAPHTLAAMSLRRKHSSSARKSIEKEYARKTTSSEITHTPGNNILEDIHVILASDKPSDTPSVKIDNTTSIEKETSPGKASPGKVSPGKVSPGKVSPGKVSPEKISPPPKKRKLTTRNSVSTRRTRNRKLLSRKLLSRKLHVNPT